MSHPAHPDSRGAAVLRAALLGNDLIAAVAPATAVQLLHACYRAGFGVVLPPSWGDELVAAEALRQLDGAGRRAAVLVACPHVAARVEALPEAPDATLVCVVAPPVAMARQLRRLAPGQPMHVTYVGGCPDADGEPSIDVRVLPDEFLAALAGMGIAVGDMPTVFEDVLPPDRRRFASLPGGVPSPAAVLRRGGPSLAELDGVRAADAMRWPAAARGFGLVDAAAGLGCACSGCLPGKGGAAARAAVAAMDPPRAASAVVSAAPGLNLERRLAMPPRPATGRTTPGRPVTPAAAMPAAAELFAPPPPPPTPEARPVVDASAAPPPVDDGTPAPSALPTPPAAPAPRATTARARPAMAPAPRAAPVAAPARAGWLARRQPALVQLAVVAATIGVVALIARLSRPVARADQAPRVAAETAARIPAEAPGPPAPPVAPGTVAADTTPAPVAAPVVPPLAVDTARRRAAPPARRVRAGEAPVPIPSRGAPAPIPAPRRAPPDSAARAAPAAGPDSAALEREAIRRELELRRRRIDSIQRRLDSLNAPRRP